MTALGEAWEGFPVIDFSGDLCGLAFGLVEPVESGFTVVRWESSALAASCPVWLPSINAEDRERRNAERKLSLDRKCVTICAMRFLVNRGNDVSRDGNTFAVSMSSLLIGSSEV